MNSLRFSYWDDPKKPENRKDRLAEIAVIGAPEGGESEKPTSPCARCRQAIIDLIRRDDQPVSIIMASTHGKILRVSDFLDIVPFNFGLDDLGLE